MYNTNSTAELQSEEKKKRRVAASRRQMRRRRRPEAASSYRGTVRGYGNAREAEADGSRRPLSASSAAATDCATGR